MARHLAVEPDRSGDRIELHDYDAAGTLQGDGASSDGTSVTIDGVSDLRDL